MLTARDIDERLASSPLFAACSKKELRAVSGLATETIAKTGRVLTTQGKPGSEFMLITDGSASVWIDNEPVATLGPGDFFGELALLTKGPRTATVVAETDMVLLAVSRREFSTMLDSSPSLTRKLLATLASRLREADRTATHAV